MSRPPCSVEGCDKSSVGRGWCAAHYARWRLHGDVQADKPLRGAQPICSVTGCDKGAVAHGWCRGHYGRWVKHGDIMEATPLRGWRSDPSERFWARVDKSGDCWRWTGRIDVKGYGQFDITSSRSSAPAHRFAYEDSTGAPIPDGLQIDHICGTRNCVNPEHLRIVTNKQNQENITVTPINSKSGILGVSWAKDRGKWRATVGHHGKKHYGGEYDSISEAADAVRELRNKLFTHNNRDRGQESA